MSSSGCDCARCRSNELRTFSRPFARQNSVQRHGDRYDRTSLRSGVVFTNQKEMCILFSLGQRRVVAYYVLCSRAAHYVHSTAHTFGRLHSEASNVDSLDAPANSLRSADTQSLWLHTVRISMTTPCRLVWLPAPKSHSDSSKELCLKHNGHPPTPAMAHAKSSPGASTTNGNSHWKWSTRLTYSRAPPLTKATKSGNKVLRRGLPKVHTPVCALSTPKVHTHLGL